MTLREERVVAIYVDAAYVTSLLEQYFRPQSHHQAESRDIC